MLQPGNIWSAWEFDAGIVIPLALTAVLYAIGSRKCHRAATARERNLGLTPALQKLCFWAGWGGLVIALLSPLHPLGEVLFSAHMVQHEILMLVSAPLLVLSRPLVTFLWALPMPVRRRLGQWSKQRHIRKLWLFLTGALTAWSLHAIAIWLWHFPFLFDLTVTSDLVHTAQHLSFLLTALLFWWALLYAHGRKSYGAGVLYVFSTAVHTGILGALLTFTPHIWYSVYRTTTQAWGLTPLEDQQLGGLVMWVPASIVYIAAGLILFAAWLKESDALLQRASVAK